MKRLRLCCGACMLALSLLPARVHAQHPGEREAVLAVVQRLFDGMASRDTMALRAVLADSGYFTSIRAGAADGRARAQPFDAAVRQIGQAKQKYLERMWDAQVSIAGPIANVWTPYDFHLDGKFSHCGVDNFTLMRTAGAWKIVAVSYTVQAEGCAPSPLGAP